MLRHSLSVASALVLACGGQADPKAAAPQTAPTKTDVQDLAPPPAPPTPAPAAGVQPDGSVVSAVSWFHGSLDEALAEAKRTDRLVFADVSAYWCPPCRRLDEEVFTQPEVGEFLGKGYVAIHIDAEKGEGPELVTRYKAQAYPTLLVLEASGIEKGRVVDFIAPQELLAALAKIEEGGNVLAALESKVEAAPDDLELRYELAHAYALAARQSDANAAFDAVLVGDPKDELGLASKVLYNRALFVTYKLEGEPDRAIQGFEALQRQFPESKSALAAYRQIGRLQHELGRSQQATASLDAMLATDPSSESLVSSYGWFSFREKCNPTRGLEVVLGGIEAYPQSAELHYLAAELHHQLGDHVAALAAIKAASALEPESAYYKRQVARLTAAGAKAG